MSEIVDFGRAFDCDSLAGFGTTIFVGNVILRAIEDMGRFLANVELLSNGFIIDALQVARDSIEDSIVDLGSVVLDVNDTQTAVIVGAVNGSTNKIESAIQTVAINSEATANSNTANVIDILTGLVIEENDKVSGVIDTAVAPVLNQVQTNGFSIQNLSSTAETAFSNITDVLGGVLGVLQDGLKVTVNNAINIEGTIFTEILEKVQELLVTDIDRIDGLLGSLGDIFAGVISEVVGAFESVIEATIEPLILIRDAVLHNKDENTAVIEKADNPTDEGLGSIIAKSVFENVKPDLELSSEDLRKGMVDFFQGPTGLDCLTDETAQLVLEGLPVTAAAKWVVDILTWMATVGPLVGGIAGVKAQPHIQDFLACNPSFPLPIAETIISFQRGLLSAEDAQRNIARTGLGAEDAERLVNIGFTIPDLTLIYNMFYRDLIDDDAFTDQLLALGYTPGVIEPLKTLAFFIPPVQDLITMAVREVFSPEIAQAQGQFEDFPEDFSRFAQQQGVTDFWARNYWAAHWSLPSVQMGFEMLHRGVIDKDELEFLLRALDVMPIWRDRLIQISFTPFTRVDIRRMHRLGVLTEDEVLRAYKDIGYDDEKADKQLQFVLAANAEDEIITLDVASDLTRNSIVSFYKDGIISREIALALLIQAGINLAASELFLLAADFDLERRERKQSIDIILDRFKFGTLSFTEAADQITALDLETKERQLALFDLERVSEQLRKIPSKADLDKFLKADIIGPSEYVQQLERIGYSFVWSNRYLELANKAA